MTGIPDSPPPAASAAPAAADTPPAAPAPAAAPAGFDWAAALGSRHADFAPVLTAKQWDGPAAVLEAYTNLESLTGARVTDPTGYTLTLPDGLDRTAVWPEALDADFRRTAVEAGLTDRQAQGIHGWYMARLKAGMEEQARANAAVEQTLRQEYGAEYDTRIAQARRAAERFGADPFLDVLEQRTGGAELVRFFANIGAAFAEDTLAGSGAAPSAPQEDIDRLTADEAFQKALWDRGHPGHHDARQRWEAAHRKAYG